MSTETERGVRPRIPLSRDRVLRAAVRVADEGGLESLTMRRVAEELGAEAMSLYYHVASKEDLLDGLVDVIAAEINDVVERLAEPSGGTYWKTAIRRRILSAREVFLRHRWAPGVFEERAAASPAVLRYYDGLVGLMRDGGFSYDLIHHALHALGSRALGFSQEPFAPGDGPGGPDSPGGSGGLGGGAGAAAPPPDVEQMAAQFPHLAGMMAEIVHDDPDPTLGWCDDQAEFEFGLDLILDGLDGMRQRR